MCPDSRSRKITFLNVGPLTLWDSVCLNSLNTSKSCPACNHQRPAPECLLYCFQCSCLKFFDGSQVWVMCSSCSLICCQFSRLAQFAALNELCTCKLLVWKIISFHFRFQISFSMYFPFLLFNISFV